MGMLPVDQMRPSVRCLAGGEQERVAVCSHERISRQHPFQAEGPFAKRALRHPHKHSAHECFVCTPWPALVVVNRIKEAVIHRLPVAVCGMHTEMRRGIWQPACTRSFALNWIRAKEPVHCMRITMRAGMRVPG